VLLSEVNVLLGYAAQNEIAICTNLWIKVIVNDFGPPQLQPATLRCDHLSSVLIKDNKWVALRKDVHVQQVRTRERQFNFSDVSGIILRNILRHTLAVLCINLLQQSKYTTFIFTAGLSPTCLTRCDVITITEPFARFHMHAKIVSRGQTGTQ